MFALGGETWPRGSRERTRALSLSLCAIAAVPASAGTDAPHHRNLCWHRGGG